MNIQAKVALDKVKHPEFFCKHHRCLWRVMVCHPMTREMVPAKNCKGDGYCPSHARSTQVESPFPNIDYRGRAA